MIHTKENERIIEEIALLVDPELIIICKHCGKPIDQASLIGLSLICPLCGKPQNGHPKNAVQDLYADMIVICKHCGEQIDQARLRGISLICPSCGMPQNGQPHPKN
jgi:predicted amidophosphoribosyltransferase